MIVENNNYFYLILKVSIFYFIEANMVFDKYQVSKASLFYFLVWHIFKFKYKLEYGFKAF